MSQWKSNDNLFSLQEFYDNIVAVFEQNPQDPWVIGTLAWWNGYVLFIYLIYRLILYRQVPSLQQTVSKHKKQSPLDNRTRSNPADRILAQRARHAENITSNRLEEHRQSEHQELDLEGLDAEDQARLRDAQKLESGRETEKAPNSWSPLAPSCTNSPVSETGMRVSQTAAKRVSCTLLY